jgi:hypothetical protein
MKAHGILYVFRLSLGLLLVLFVAGVAVPSVLNSRHAVNAGSSVDSLRTLDIAGVTLKYKLQNIGFAFLGELFGTILALIFASRGTASRGLAQLLTVLPARKYMRPSLSA